MTETTHALTAAVAALLSKERWTISCAESCTGGGLAYALTGVAGSSAWFDGSVVTYSNRTKMQLLGVEADLLEAFGAVSDPVVSAMATGVCTLFDCDIGLAVSGVAGPSGGSEAKPVGTVHFAWRLHDRSVHTDKCHFPGDRQQVREQSVAFALSRLLALYSRNTGG